MSDNKRPYDDEQVNINDLNDDLDKKPSLNNNKKPFKPYAVSTPMTEVGHLFREMHERKKRKNMLQSLKKMNNISYKKKIDNKLNEMFYT